MTTPDNQTSQITPSCNKNPLSTSRGLSENLSLKLLCDVIFLSLLNQSDALSFMIANF